MTSTENNEPGASQEQLIFSAGIVLIRLQLLENVVKLCCSFMEVDDKRATFENIFLEDPKKSHFTLGRIIGLLKKPTHFKESFISRLDEFVQYRNRLIHTLWLENQIYSLDESVPNDIYLNISRFLDNLSQETIYMTRVFIGFNFSIGATIAEREGKLDQFESDPEYTGMKEYVPLFLSVVENK
ncbi:MAG: hypothetical protein ACYC6K_13090 [Bellilinea sp.]